MRDQVTAASDGAQEADVLGYACLTMIADGVQRLDVTVSPPTGRVAWVMHVKAYPVNLSIHLDRKGLELLTDRISQAIQDYGTPCPRCQGSGTVPSPAPCSRGQLLPCPVCNGDGLRLTAADDGVDLDDKDTGPCEMCARLADRVPVRVRGRVLFACPECAARASGDGVDLDDTDLTSGPEQE